MSIRRTVNHTLLHTWINSTENGLTKLIDESGASYMTVSRMTSGKYKSMPSRPIRKAFCRVTRLKENDLFPVVEAVETSA